VRVVLALDAAKGVAYLHSKSIVHFDLKSANLLLGYRDRRCAEGWLPVVSVGRSVDDQLTADCP
jgi:serine/threonine protein kinase